MKVTFLTTIIYPSTSANRIHTIEMANAFAEYGLNVDFLCKKINNVPFSERVEIIPKATNRSITSAWKFARYIKNNPSDFWFCREPHLLLLVSIFYFLTSWSRLPFILYEVHDLPRDFFDGVVLSLLKQLRKFRIIVITKYLAEDLNTKYKIHNDKMSVFPDGVNLEKFKGKTETHEARKVLGFKDDVQIVVYAGSLFVWKGVYTLLEVAKKIPKAKFIFVGGSEKDILKFTDSSKELDNVVVPGHVSQDKVSLYLAAADVLVLPNSSKYRMSERYTSPLKLFEYMASKRPIVASALPSIREILSDGVNAYLVDPDSVDSLLEGIKLVLSVKDNEVIINQAYNDVQSYSWNNRVNKIMKVIEKEI